MKPRPAAAAPPAQDWRLWAGVAARGAVAAVLLFSGIHKAAAPAEEFMAVLEGYALLPPAWLPFFSRFIPWMEVLGGTFLLGGLWVRPAAAACGALSAGFFGALLLTKLRGFELPNCGCFGPGFHLERWQAMCLDAALVALGACAWRWGGRRWALDNWVEEGS